MGCGSRLKFIRSQGAWFGIALNSFPFTITLDIGLGTYSLSIGFGRAYDKV